MRCITRIASAGKYIVKTFPGKICNEYNYDVHKEYHNDPSVDTDRGMLDGTERTERNTNEGGESEKNYKIGRRMEK